MNISMTMRTLLVLLGGLLLVAWYMSKRMAATYVQRDWAFVQAVGGMALGQPTRDTQGEWLLPVQANVSGAQHVTIEPTARHAGLVCRLVLVKTEGRTIKLTLVTASTTGSQRHTAQCPAARLGKLAAGEYQVQYHAKQQAPVALGTITLQ